MDFTNLYEKKVTVFGTGVSGLSAIKFLSQEGAELSVVEAGEVESWGNLEALKKFVTVDQCHPEEKSEDIFADSQLIILSPGIPREHVKLRKALNRGVKVWCEIELASKFCHVPIIAVTGTNGKTTTVSLIGEMLKNSGYNPFVGGNIGTPFCEYAVQADRKKYDYVVLELSSFQLESMEDFKPHIAILLNLSLSHGERYSNIEDYGKAKFHIADNMDPDDYLLFSKGNELVTEWTRTLEAQKWKVDPENLDLINEELGKLYSTEHFKLAGDHNLVNLYFAIKALEFLDVEGKGIQKTIDEFSGLPHRLEKVVGDFPFSAFNDAKSTNWESTLTAIEGLAKYDNSLALILGGQIRGHGDDIGNHLETLSQAVDRIFLIGETTDQLASELDGKVDYEKCYNLEKVLELCRQNEFTGMLLLSPAFPSFDQFDNYQKRGEHFKSLLKNW